MEHAIDPSAETENEDTGRPVGAFALEAFAAAIVACTDGEAGLAPIAIGIPTAEDVLRKRYEYEPGIAALIAEQAGRCAVRQAAEAARQAHTNN